MDSFPARRHPRPVAAGAHYRRPVPDVSVGGRAARAFAYVLLVVTCTVVAALGGYQIGVRSHPSAAVTTTAREQSVHRAVSRAVAAQAARDRTLRRGALAKAMRWQRAKFDEELSAKVSEVRLAEAANAERAYRRGRTAGRDALITEVRQRKSAGPAAAGAEAAGAQR